MGGHPAPDDMHTDISTHTHPHTPTHTHTHTQSIQSDGWTGSFPHHSLSETEQRERGDAAQGKETRRNKKRGKQREMKQGEKDVRDEEEENRESVVELLL